MNAVNQGYMLDSLTNKPILFMRRRYLSQILNCVSILHSPHTKHKQDLLSKQSLYNVKKNVNLVFTYHLMWKLVFFMSKLDD